MRLPDGDFLTTAQACLLLQVSRTSLNQMRLENRAPPSFRWGRSRLWPSAELSKWYAARVQEAIAESEETPDE
jgi:predicted DNA-binding transcriptional regulator AlpA